MAKGRPSASICSRRSSPTRSRSPRPRAGVSSWSICPATRPSFFLTADCVAVRAYPRLFVAAGCDLGDDPQAGLAERVLEYRGALAALESTAPELRAQREHRTARARAGGMSDSELAEHERETLAYLRERVEQPTRILTDGAVYLYGGILCEGMRFEAEPSASEQAT